MNYPSKVFQLGVDNRPLNTPMLNSPARRRVSSPPSPGESAPSSYTFAPQNVRFPPSPGESAPSTYTFAPPNVRYVTPPPLTWRIRPL
eukprot:482636-Prorocentrum_minimum.AAC.1